MASQKRFSFRGFTSFTLTLSFILMSVSGIILYIVPPGRVAYWINWKLLGMSKDNWASVHTIFSYLFIITAIVHLYYNWRVFTGYIVNKLEKGIRRKKELAASLILTLAIFIATFFDLPPFGTIMTIGESIKSSWETEQSPAPVPHTELKTLDEVVKTLDMELVNVLDKLERHGVTVKDTGATLKSIATDNGISPSELYDIVSHRSDGKGMGPGDGTGDGRGIGNGRGEKDGPGAGKSRGTRDGRGR